jgi:5-oxopent-3-ene-1,2,5-tricarboxylate decarboxylase / 2-hydroxyhepta-2,4-diene-1,7-dioate isomerase
VLDAAIEQEAEEEWIAARVAEGAAVDGLYPLTGEWRRRYDAERDQEGTR